MVSHTDSNDKQPQLTRDGYIDLNGDENISRLRAHQAFLVGLGFPQEVTTTLDHIGIQAATTPAFEQILAIYKEGARGAYVVDRGDRRIAMIDRGEGLYRVELFEPRAGQEAKPGFVHYAFIWPDWKPREDEVRGMVELTRTANLNGNNDLAFLATPDGYEAEIVTIPVNFN